MITYKRKDKKFNAKLVAIADHKQTEERILKSSWHALIVLAGLYELRNHRTVVSKVLACGLIGFHLDAAVCDFLDRPTTLQRMLRKLRD